jgi:Leucine-rich repeat (LRR) protein
MSPHTRKQQQQQQQCHTSTSPKWRKHTKVIFILSIFLSLPSLAQTASEKSILIEFYEATRGDNWKERVSWNTNDPVCSWYGVFCEGRTANDDEGVTRIDLNNNNLNGKIPEVFWQLPHLLNLNLRSNLLTSASLEGLQTADPSSDPRSPLELLILSENHVTGVDGIGHARETLRNVNINRNQIDRELPADLFELTNLETLYIAFNQIPGTVPTLIGRLSKLAEFYAFDNRFSGQLPSEIGLLDSCQILGLGNNFLTGTLPTDMNQMVNMRDMSIHHVTSSDDAQQFTGVSGPLLSFGDMPFLTLLFLDGNSLSGTLPSDFLRHNNNAEAPVSVGLTKNNITGTIPKSLERFQALSIDLVGNPITGIPEELCEKGGWMGGLVEELKCDAILCGIGTFNVDGRATGEGNPCLPCEDADSTQFFGSTFCATSTSMDSIWQILAAFYVALAGEKWTIRDGWDIFDNLANGENPTSLESLGIDICDGWYGIDCENGEVTSISLPQNALFGTIPETVFSIPLLKVFDVSNNNVELPNLEVVGRAENLSTLILSNIKMEALDGIGQLTGLEQLYLDGQTFIANISEDLYQLTSLKALHLQHGHFVGTMSTDIGRLSNLVLYVPISSFISQV